MDNYIKEYEQSMEAGNDKIEDTFKEHIIKLHIIGNYMITREFKKLIQYIEDEYFKRKVFDHKYYTSADDFVFRMDITGLPYSNIFKMTCRDLEKKDYGQYLLGLKMIIAKLKGNQRYTYFDRDDIREILKYIEEEYDLLSINEEKKDILDLVDAQTIKDALVGFEELNFEEYIEGSTFSIYKTNKDTSEKFYEKELKSAVNKGIIYHYIVEMDHYINVDIHNRTHMDWVFLAKLLNLHYITEKNSWTRDMTRDMLRIYFGIMNCCELQMSEEIIYQITTENLKTIIKKMSKHMYKDMTDEITEVINYLINVYWIHRDSKYITYIKDFLVILENLGHQEKVNRVIKIIS